MTISIIATFAVAIIVAYIIGRGIERHAYRPHPCDRCGHPILFGREGDLCGDCLWH